MASAGSEVKFERCSEFQWYASDSIIEINPPYLHNHDRLRMRSQ